MDVWDQNWSSPIVGADHQFFLLLLKQEIDPQGIY